MTARDRKRRIHALLSRWETIRFANSEKECVEDFAAMIVDLEDRLAATPAPPDVDAPDNANAATTSANATPAPLDVERCACGHLNASCDRPDADFSTQIYKENRGE